MLGADRSRYASRSILLVGTGHSAATNLVALAELAAQAPDTWITWIVRRDLNEKHPQPVPAIADDPFPDRVRVTQHANQLAADDSNHVSLLSGTVVEALTWHADLERFSVRLAGKHAGELEFDRIIANVGYRPDHGLYREIHVRQDPFHEGACGNGWSKTRNRRQIFNRLCNRSRTSTSSAPRAWVATRGS